MSIDKLKVGDKLFTGKITKITAKYVHVEPTVPQGESRYTKKEINRFFSEWQAELRSADMEQE